MAKGIDASFIVQSYELDKHIPFGTPTELQKALLDESFIGEIDEY
jgi:hypothetical protein